MRYHLFVTGFLLIGMCTACTGVNQSETSLSRRGDVIYLDDEGWRFRPGDSPVDSLGIPLWTYTGDDDSWMPFSRVEHRSEDSLFLWAKIQLPETLPVNPVLALSHGLISFETYIDTTRVARFGTLRPGPPDRSVAAKPPIIPLPEDAGGQTMYLRIFLKQTDFPGIIPQGMIGTAGNILLHWFRSELDELVIGLIILFTGLISILLLFAGAEIRSPMLFYLGVFSLALGVYYVGSSFVTRTVVPSGFWYYFMAFLYLFPVGFLGFLEEVTEQRFRSVLRWLWQIHLGFVIVVLALDTLNISTYFSWAHAFFSLLTISLLVSIATAFPAIRRGDFETRVFGLGLIVLFGPAIHDTVILGFNIAPETQGISQWGVLAFLAIVGYLPVHRIKVNTRQMREQSRALRLANSRLAEYTDTLEQRVEERTAELRKALDDLTRAQDELLHTEKMASLGRLTAGIAHEIKNPLNFVNNFAAISIELTKDIEKAIESRQYLLGDAVEELGATLQDLKFNAERIKQHGERADAIVRSMLQHTRGIQHQTQPAVLNTVVEEYVKLAWHAMRAQYPGHEVIIEHDYDESVGELEVAPPEIGRVIINLMNNACWAVMEKAKNSNDHYIPHVLVRTKNLGENVEIRVWDNGPGIPEDRQPKVFEPFFTTKPAGEGTGLGLSLSYDIIVQGHGGTMRVETEEGKYTAVIIELPRQPVTSAVQ